MNVFRIAVLLCLAHFAAATAGGGEMPSATSAAEIAPAGSFRFAVLGDPQPNSAYSVSTKTYDEILAQINELGPDFTINAGDIVWGYISDQEVVRGQINRFVDYTRRTLRVPCHYAFGNHEMTAGVKVMNDIFGRLYYSFNHKGVHFVFLNTDLPRQKAAVTGEQLAWLKNDLANNASRMPVIVTMHRPMFPCLKWPDDMDDRMQRMLHELFLSHGVKAVFSGHQHLYHEEEHDGIRYYISGGGGGILTCPCDERYGESCFHHFLLVTMRGGEASVEVRRADIFAPKIGPATGRVPEFAIFATPFMEQAVRLADLMQLCAAVPPPSPAALAEGDACLRAGKLQESLRKYEEALQESPACDAARNNRAVAYARSGLLQQAEAEFAILANKKPALDEALYNLSLIVWMRGRRDEAKALMRKERAAYPRSPLVRLAAAAYYWKTKDYQRAEAECRAVTPRDPAYDKAQLILASIAMEKGDYAAVLAISRDFADNYPESPIPPVLIGDALCLQGRYSEAEESYSRALRASPKNPSLLNRMANLQLRQKNEGEALKAYTKLASSCGSYGPARFNIALCHIKDGMRKAGSGEDYYEQCTFDRYEEIVNILKSLADGDTDNALRAQALTNLGFVYHSSGLMSAETVADCFRRAAAADPTLSEPLLNLGNIHLENEAIEKAQRLYEEALSLKGNSLEGLWNLALVLLIQKEFEPAIAQYRRLLAVVPRLCKAHNALADVFAYLHEERRGETRYLQEAIAALRKSLDIDPAQCGLSYKLQRLEEKAGAPPRVAAR